MEKTIPLGLLQDQAFDGSSWHGSNLRTSLIGVGPTAAAWSPGPGRPSIWGIVLHCAYWKHRVWQRVTGLRAPFPRQGANWPAPPGRPTGRAWAEDRGLLTDTHRLLSDALGALGQGELEVAGPNQVRTRMLHVVGIMLHDTYHAGQIRLLRKLHAQRETGRGG